jgi:hypothetical protein
MIPSPDAAAFTAAAARGREILEIWRLYQAGRVPRVDVRALHRELAIVNRTLEMTGYALGIESKAATALDDLEHKAFGAFEIKDEASGKIEAIIATFDVVDKDGDIVRKGAIAPGSTVAISGYGHSALFGERPVGKGTIVVDGNKAIVKGQLFMELADARDTLTVLKGMGASQQWSWGYAVLGAEVPTEAQRKQGAYRVITKTETFEASPVIRGAGVGTRTLAAKGPAAAAPAKRSTTKRPSMTAADQAAMREIEQATIKRDEFLNPERAQLPTAQSEVMDAFRDYVCAKLGVPRCAINYYAMKPGSKTTGFHLNLAGEIGGGEVWVAACYADGDLRPSSAIAKTIAHELLHHKGYLDEVAVSKGAAMFVENYFG